jgi:tetratricopeptide (TPR) repeat protein
MMKWIEMSVKADWEGFLSRIAISFSIVWVFIQFADVALDGLQKDLLHPKSLDTVRLWAETNQLTYKIIFLIFTSAALLAFFELLATAIRTATHRPEKLKITLPNSDPYKAIVTYAASLCEKNHFDHFFRVYDVFSRHLWLEGRLETRIQLGMYAEEAATKANDNARLIQVLIDDLGWTNAARGHYAAAKDSINRGINKANKLNFPFWEAKGLRHLAGISTLERDHVTSLATLYKSEEIAKSLPDKDQKGELLMGIEYAKATTLLRQGKPLDALIAIGKFTALAHQSGDKSRLVRVNAIEGQAHLLGKNWADAKEAFTRGLKAAQEMGRVDEVIRNHRGLAKCCRHLKEKEREIFHNAKADELECETPVPFEVDPN